MSGFTFLMIAFSLVCFFDVLIAVKGFRWGGSKGIALGCACLGAFVATLSYTISLFIQDYLTYSILSSIYFGGIDFTLVSMMIFNWYFVNPSEGKRFGKIYWLVFIFAALDELVFAINPFWEIAISYVYHNTKIACYGYEMHLLYRVHLFFDYAVILVVLYELISKSIRAPRIYARQYIYSVYALIAVVLINAAYLFAPGLFGEENVDYSLIGYSVTAFAYYWNCYNYSSHGLLNHFHRWIFENIDQGLVLFDFDDKLILHNRKAVDMLPPGLFTGKTITLQDFLTHCGIRRSRGVPSQRSSFQCFIGGRPLRCDYSVQLDKKHRLLGRLFVFTTVTTQYDLLTGFRTWADFKENADTLYPVSAETQVVATCDINSLGEINQKYGRSSGDRVLQRLAEEMRAEFPPNTVFTRSREASVAAITSDLDVGAVENIIARIQEKLQENDIVDCPILIQSSVSVRGNESVVDTIRRNLQSMRTKKLMDRTSLHSELLGSLLQALSQCDSDTGEHVQRTQKSGEELGRRIGLTDQEQSCLALLAIMHDIGKIGIPLEILNKPGKLNDSEWKMMKTHVQKGYQIAKSSQEFSGIADMILYHHERWDGRGYPEGLREEQIPLLSRIISVVDAYDAMTNDRAYRKALAESAARSELQRCAGSQFDPNIVREFILMLEENDRKQGIVVSTMSQEESNAAGDYSAGSKPAPVHTECKNVHLMAYSMYVIDSQNRIIRVDDRFETITGYSREDVAGSVMTPLSLIFEEDMSEYMDHITEISKKNEDIYLEHRLRRKDGSAIFVYCYGHMFYDSAEGENRMRIVIIDRDNPLTEQ
ncbi:MAG: HD domain-containing phosphohydrolase [Faecousia sp.]